MPANSRSTASAPSAWAAAEAYGACAAKNVERVVPPVVELPLAHQPLLRHERVHRQQLDRRDPESRQVLERRVVREARVRAAQRFGDRGVELREAAQVGLVDHGVIERDAGLRHAAPVESALGEAREGDAAPRPVVGSGEPPRVRVEQGVHRVEGVVEPRGPVDAQAVVRAGHEPRRRALPDAVGVARQGCAFDGPVEVVGVEHHEVDGAGVFGPHADHAAVGSDANAEVVEGIGVRHAIYSSSWERSA